MRIRAIQWVAALALLLALVVVAFLGCEAASKNVATTDGDADGDSDSDTGDSCEDGTFTCEEDSYMECIDGTWSLVEVCEDACVAWLGCVLCDPGSSYCEDTVVMTCNDDGMGYGATEDCADYGVECVEGACVFGDPCEQAMATSSNIGCEYWAVDLDNAENFADDAAAGQFAVAVANIGSNGPANVQVHINNAVQGAPLELELVESKSVAESDLYIFLLPRRDADGDNVTDNVDDGPQSWLSSRAFRITSDVPVVAYQFNTLDQQFSNDASLLLPTSGLGEDHLVVGYPPGAPMAAIGKNRGYITILGTAADTTVYVDVTEDIQVGTGVPAILAGNSAQFTIGPFDVLNLETRLFTFGELMGGHDADLTGSRVMADKPVAVFFGVDLTSIGQSDVYPDSCCAEHLEQQVIPSKAMGQKFVVTHSAQRNSGTAEMDYYRIAAYDTATVTTSLPAPNDSFTLGTNEYREFFVNTGFTVETTDGYLHVAQFLVEGGNTTAGIGDSALLYVPAVEQRRGLYVFTTGQGFASNYAVISAPQGATLRVDGNDVTTTCDGPVTDGVIDSITYESWTCEIADGTHTVHSGTSPEETDQDIGVFVYGYYNAGSYAYPAGADTKHINPIVIE